MTDATMELAIPTDLPVNDAQVVVDESKAPKDTQVAAQASVTHEQAREFLKKYDLIPLLNELLSDVLVTEPADPIDAMTKWLLRHTPTVEEAQTPEDVALAKEASATRNAQVSQKHDQAVDYCTRFRLPQLIDELLAAMVKDSPPDQARFAMSWLRWNKKVFIMKHNPPGYKDFTAAQDADREKLPS
jgi:hypothetical protein